VSIYTSPPARTDTFAVGAAPLVKALSWTVVQVIVDNPTTWWLYLPTAQRFIHPGVMGAVVPLPGSTQVQVQWQAPVGYSLPPPIAGQQATLVWLSEGVEAAPHPGIATVTSQQQTVLQSVIAPAGGGNTVHIPVPAGTLAIGFAVRSEAIPGEPGHFYETPGLVSIIGDQTDIEYFATTAATDTSVLAVPFDSSDATVAVDVVAAAGEQSKIDVLAWPVPISVAVRQNPGDPALGVTLFVEGTNSSYSNDTGLGGTAELLGVSLFEATPAPWQSAASSVRIQSSLGAGGSVTPVAGVAGKTIYVHTISVVFDAAVAANNLDVLDGATVVGTISMAVANPGAQDWKGRPLTAGNGIVLKASAAAAVRGTLVYTQQ
jgi:hypothetical protein